MAKAEVIVHELVGMIERGEIRLPEMQRLRKENRELRIEKEILKKASAYFAK